MQDYAFTLRRTMLCKDKRPLEEQYEEHLELFRQSGAEICDHEYETKAGLHVHGIMRVPFNFYFKKLRFRGWNLDVKIMYDEVGWLSYIRKEKLKKCVEVIPLFRKQHALEVMRQKGEINQ